jgi:chorismate--pyruvate lyase
LVKLSANAFSVTLRFEGWQALRAEECVALNLPTGSDGWVREVYLLGQASPWVYARSVASQSALHGGLNLAELGSRPLGELLFCDQAFARQPIEVCRYPAGWLPPEAQTDNLWARRSRFDRGPLSVLVAEVFLPALWNAIGAHPENC